MIEFVCYSTIFRDKLHAVACMLFYYFSDSYTS